VRAGDGTDVGRVAHVLADPDVDIFDGVVISLANGGHRFVDASQVEAIDADGVTLTLEAAAVDRLPEPAANPATLETGPDDMVPDDLGDKLRRAWNVISGNT
jgi:hypothetical protein